MFRQPIGDIQKKFRTSELVLLSWQSKERSYFMEKKYKRPTNTRATVPEVTELEAQDVLDDTGTPDVRKMTGNQVLGLLHNAGIKVPPPPIAIMPQKAK